MSFVAWSVVYGEQPTAAKWNILGTNDASFNDGTGIGTDAIDTANIQDDAVTMPKINNPYKCSVTLSADQTISTTNATKIAFDTEIYDPNSNFDTSTNLYTAAVTGDYLVCGVVRVTNISDYVILDAYVDGSLNRSVVQIYPGSSAENIPFSSVIHLTAGQTLGLYSTSGDSSYVIDISATSIKTAMDIHLLSM